MKLILLPVNTSFSHTLSYLLHILDHYHFTVANLCLLCFTSESKLTMKVNEIEKISINSPQSSQSSFADSLHRNLTSAISRLYRSMCTGICTVFIETQ